MIHYHRNRYREGDVFLSSSSPAFRFGTGFFETMLYNGKRVCHFDRHSARVHSSLDHFCIPYEPAPFEEIIPLLLEKNGLTGRTARVNIFYPVAGSTTMPVVTVAPYERRLDRVYRLTHCPDHHVSTLNRYKTMAYMFFNLAHARAIAEGYDDALLTDLEGKVLETTTAALLFRKDGVFIEPATSFKLPSIALDIARERLDIERRPVGREELAAMDHAYALNSLVGMRPVTDIAGELAFEPDETSCAEVTELITA
ncbi:aminotransferase class IV [Salidesulfovibrio onnuriiensis]|uniref:aminotransferase class IV n=1 Tax=Salidesulfovibrio onnuriiensis TaxID=2583823 RepID=UPI0011CC09BD|nr:aminotransferase class IV [Salidesulfovibrio onnuriiensis]